jgi:hypothetical protein
MGRSALERPNCIDQPFLGAIAKSSELQLMKARLKEINEKLWDAVCAIRALDAKQDFGIEFVTVARSIYRLNDERSEIKRSIDVKLLSVSLEAKEY